MGLTGSCRLCLAFILCLSPEKEQKKALEKQKGLDETIHKQISLPWRVEDAAGHLVQSHVNQLTFANCSRQILVNQHEKVGENRDKFYLPPKVCQHVYQLLLCLSHTPT